MASKTGNLSRAAERLRVSQPALSHALNKLRDEFGDPLFVRSSHGVTMTPKAVALVSELRPLLAQLETLYISDDGDLSNLERTFTLASTTYFELQVIAPLTKKLVQLAPKVVIATISLQGRTPREELEDGRIDLAVAAYFDELPPSFRRRVLGEDPLVCLIRKNHGYLRSKKKLQKYLSCPHVVIAVPPGVPQGIDLVLSKMKEKRRVVAAINNFLTAPLLLPGNDYILTCPLSLARFYRDQYDLVIAETPVKVPPIRIQMVWHERSHRDLLHNAVRDLIVPL